MKNVQISLDEERIAQLDQVAGDQQKTRTAVIREAIDAWVRRQRIAFFEQQWISAAQADRSDDGIDEWVAAESWETDESR